MTGAPSSVPEEARVAANGLELVYEQRGPADGPPLLLIMGLGTQLLGWPEPFVDALAAEGFRVIRFDNRDIGLSTKLEKARPVDDVRLAFLKAILGLPVRAPYRLDDMAADTVGLLDALAIDSAHLVGASMGGMIGQIVAAKHPERTRSLTSIMSSSGARRLPNGRPRVMRRLVSRPPATADIDTLVRHLTETVRLIGSPELQHSPETWAELIRASVARSYYPPGTARQLLAVLASGSREMLLPTIASPTLVLHGEADPLVPLAHGRHTAACIPGARFETVPGMGHDIPPPLQSELAARIAGHARDSEP